MPATVQFGRVMSGRGYVPGMYTTSDIPPAPFAKDLPPHMRIQLEALAHRSSIETDAAAHQTHHALHRSVAELQSIHPKARPSAQPQIRSESMFPQHWPLEDFHTQQPQRLYVLNDSKRPMTADNTQLPAKRARISVPDLSAYGRSTSDSPMSLQRRMANAAELPVNVLDGRLVFPPQTTETRHLKSFHSGPARIESRPLPNYRIYSNAFQGGRGTGTNVPYSLIQDKALGLRLKPHRSLDQSHSQDRMDPTPHPALLKQPPPPQSNPEPPRDVVTVSDTLESPQSGVTASLNSESKKDASQHTDTATAANTAAHTDAAVAQATVSHLTDVAPKNGLRFSEQAQHPLGSVAVTQLKGYSPRADDSKGYSTKPEGSKGLTAEGNSPCGSYSPDAPDAAPTVSTASESATDKPSISAKHSVLSMTLDSAVSTPASSADVISQHLDTDGDQVMGSHDEASSFGNKQGADQQAQQHSSDGIHEAPASSKGSPIASNAPDNAERFQRTVDSAAGEDALPRPSAAHEMLRSLSGSQLAEQGAQSRVNSPPKQPPSTQLKTHKSSWVNGPAAEGHAANGPASNGPAPDAPASSRAPAAEGAAFNGPASTGPTSNGPATDAPAPARGPTVLRSFENQGPPTFPHMGPFNTLTFPSLGSNYGQAFSNHNPPHGQSSQTLPSTHPVKHQLSQAGFNSHMGQTHFSQQSSQHAGQGFNPAVQGGGTPDSLGGYSQAQLQAMLASCMRRDEHREEAVLGAASHDFASISQWLQQAHDVAAPHTAAGKSQRPRTGLHDPRSVPRQVPGLMYHNQGIPDHLQGIPGHPQGIPGLQARPIQAQLQVLQDSFNRVARPLCSDPSLPPTYPSHGLPSNSFSSSSFPPSLHMPGGYPLGTTPSHDFPRVTSAANPRQDSTGMPRVGSPGNLQHQGLQQSHNLGRSSLPPSVAKYLAELGQHQSEQHHSGSNRQQPASAAANQTFNMPTPSLLDQAWQSQLNGSASGTAASSRPLDSVRIGGQYDKLASGFSLPSRVITDGATGGVRNPALLNRPVATSHRDPHHSLQGTHQDSNSRFHAIANRAHTPFASNSADPAPLAPAATPRDAVSRQFPPAGVNPEQQMHSIPPAVQALAALLSNSKLSASDVTHLQSLANSEETGNLGQLAAQLEMAIQLAQSSGQPQMHTQPHTQAVTLPEPTHRVQIPAAQLMDRSAARVASANLVSSGAATVASGASGVAPGAPAQGVQETAEPASRQQPARTDKAAAQKLSRQEPASALDLVAEVAAAEETTEPSELLMLAAETLAGLNSTVPRTSGDHARSGTASLEHSSNEGPVSKAGKQKSIPEGPKSAQRRAKAQHRPAVPPTGSVSTAPFGNASTSVHPVLGLYVPHARRSYLRDTALKGEAAASHAGHAEQNVQAMHTLYPGPVKARKIACPETQKHAGDAARYPLPLRRVPSDSSMTVSANSNQD